MLWTDTAGGFSLIEAVGCGPHGLFLLRARVPDWVFSQFLPRSDDPIGVQEALAVWRLVTSFKKLLGGARHTSTPTMTGLRRHTSRITLIRRRKTPWWLLLVFVSEEHLLSMFSRIESKAIPADGPTRPDDVGCSLLRKLCAAELPAYLPGWLANLWHPFANDALTCEDILLGWADRA